jgi:hypothetical protein
MKLVMAIFDLNIANGLNVEIDAEPLGRNRSSIPVQVR